MKTIISILLLAVASMMVSGQASASPPLITCGSYYVAQGESCQAFRQAYDVNGRPTGVRPMQYAGNVGYQSYGFDQQFYEGGYENRVYERRPPVRMVRECHWVRDTAIGAGLGALYARWKHHNVLNGALGGGALGAGVGMTWDCQMVPVREPVPVQYERSYDRSYGRPYDGNYGVESDTSHCRIDGEDWQGLTRQKCRELHDRLSEGSRDTYNSRYDSRPQVREEPGYSAETSSDSLQKKEAVPTENNPCASRGRILLRITKKDNPRYGEQVCVLPKFKDHPDFQ